MTIIVSPEERQFSRWRFLQSTAAVGAASVLPTGTLSAQAAEPKRGGHFRLGIGGGTTDSLDPATYENSFMQRVGGTLHCSLTEVSADGALLPMLATEWEAGPGAVKWIFRVHKDVVFHDGKTMTADDAYSDKLAHGDRVGGNLDLDGMRVAERWWFA